MNRFATLKLRVLDWLFSKLFGPVDIDAEIYTTQNEILILELVVRTKRGEFAFPLLHTPIPEASSGYIIDAVESADSLEAGIIDHVGTVLPALAESETEEDEEEDTGDGEPATR